MTTQEGRFRVLDADRESLRLVESVDGGDVVDVERTGYGGDLAAVAAGLRQGYVVEATLDWADGGARFADAAVVERTLVAYADGVTGLFEAALDAWEEARRAGDAVNARPTFSTDGEPNGAVYTFAEQPGARDVFADLRAGRTPLDPLVRRLDEREDCDHEVFVMRPATHDFVLVYGVLRKRSLLADTVRDTYDCPRPDEPLA